MLARIVGGLGAAAAALLGWGWFEAGWVRLRRVDVEVPGLPPELDGLRVAHLSDFHLGVPSRGRRAVRELEGDRASRHMGGRAPTRPRARDR